jgi:hypothetical protein
MFSSVPPGTAIYANFDHLAPSVDLLILYDNPNDILPGVNIVYDTQARGADPQ